MKIFSTIIIILSFVWSGIDLEAQVEAHASLDSNYILVGDQINLTLAISCPADYVIDWPQLNDTIISAIEILNKSRIDTFYSEDNSRLFLKQTLKITSFDSGYYAIPPFQIKYKEPGGQLIQYTETEALLLEVSTVPVNMEEEIRDIKAPIEAPYTFREALPWIIGVVLAIALGYFVFYFLKKRKKDEPVFKAPAKPKLPPHQIALGALDNLRFKKIWQSGRIKDYHTELTDIIREYLNGRFFIHALEMTTDEIMEALNTTASNDQAKQKIRQTLMMADLVKFAKMQPLPLEHDTSLNNAFGFVKETMHIAVPENNITIDDKKEKLSAPGEGDPVQEVSEINNNEKKEVQDV
jgi:hypothetical protein